MLDGYTYPERILAVAKADYTLPTLLADPPVADLLSALFVNMVKATILFWKKTGEAAENICLTIQWHEFWPEVWLPKLQATKPTSSKYYKKALRASGLINAIIKHDGSALMQQTSPRVPSSMQTYKNVTLQNCGLLQAESN